MHWSQGAASLKSKPDRRGRRPVEPPEAQRLAVLERELQDVRRTLSELRGALDPLASAERELDAALAHAQEIRAEGRVRAEGVRAEALSRAQGIVARGEASAQEIVSRGHLDADRIEARSEAHAEEIVLEARQRLQMAASLADMPGPGPLTGAPDLAHQASTEPPPYDPTRWVVETSKEPSWTDRPESKPAPIADDGAEVPRVKESSRADHGRDTSGEELPEPHRAVEQRPDAAAPVEEEAALQLSVSAISGEELSCRLGGSLTFAGMVALERAVAGLHGIRSVRVSPDESGATVSIVSQQPHQTLEALANLPGFFIRAAER